MNGVPAEKHLGKTIHAVLGRAAAKIRPAFEHVFATGEPLSNFELTAELPSRRGIGYWNESYFPIKDHIGQVLRVGAVVLELTKSKELEAALLRLTDKLARITAALRNKPRARESLGLGCTALEDGGAGPAGLLEGCLSEARGISQLLYDSPASAAVRHDVAGGQSIAAGPESLSPLSSREREVVVS